jgi:drug/metabolite transporter (DMT)-like permease
MSPTGKAHLALIVSGLLFGANYWIAKSLMPAFTPVQIVGIRIFAVTILLWITDVFSGPKTKIAKKDLLLIFLAGILGVAVNQYFFFAGLKYSTPVETSILHTLSPILVVLFAIWILREKVSLRRFAGIISGLIGALIIVSTGKELNIHDLHFKGNLFIILNIISYSFYIIIIKPVMERYDSVQVLKYVFLAALFSYLPLSIVQMQDVSYAHITKGEWLALVYVVVGSTFLTYLLTIYSIKRLPATIIGFYIYMQPFIATAIGYITGKEKLDMFKIIAAIFLFAGIWLVMKRAKR